MKTSCDFKKIRIAMCVLVMRKLSGLTIKAMLAPYPSEEMTCWPVSPRVSNIKNNDPSLIEPIATAG